MVKKGIVVGHVISSEGIVNKIFLLPLVLKMLGLFLDILDFIIDLLRTLARLLSPCLTF